MKKSDELFDIVIEKIYEHPVYSVCTAFFAGAVISSIVHSIF